MTAGPPPSPDAPTNATARRAPPAVPRSIFPGALELLDESARHLRLAPAGALGVYYAGTLPFALALGAFLTSANVGTGAPLDMVVLFVVMKVAQAVFAVEMRARFAGQAAPRWTRARLARLALVQAILQPSGLFVLPVAAVLTVPLGWAYAFYGSVTALGDGETASAGAVFLRAARAARRDPKSNHVALFVLSLVGMFAWLNLVLAALLLPQALSLATGHDNAWSGRGLHIFDAPFFAVTLGLVYLALDPWAKAFYARRCFQADARRTGEDLRCALRDLPPPGI